MRYQSFACAVALTITFLAINCSAQKSGIAEISARTYGNVAAVGKLSESRASHTATLLNNGTVLIAGGTERNGVFFDDADIFDPATNSFKQARGKMSVRRVSHTGTILPDGRVLIVGGWSNTDAPEMTAEIYDPRTETFKPVGNTNFPRSAHTATLLENGKVLIAGGFDGKQNLKEAEIFNPQTNTFTAIGNMQTARLAHTATELNDGRILLTGGEMSRRRVLSSAEVFDPKTNSFSVLPNAMSVVRYKHDSVLLADGRVLIFGGSDSRDWNGKYKSAEIFNPKNGSFTPAGDMNFARFKMDGNSALLANGNVFIGGGSNSAEVFEPKTNSFTPAAGEYGRPLYFSTVTLLRDGRALVAGGYGNGTREAGPISTNQAWIFKL